MNLPKQTIQYEPDYLAGLNNAFITENNNFPQTVLKSMPATKRKTFKTENRNCETAVLQKASKELKSELALLKKELQISKKSNSLKDAEIESLKIKLGDVRSSMEQFSYVASHDLKEPLRMVTSYLGLLKNKFGSQLDNKANTYIDFAIDGGARLHTMFNGLLDLSQIGRVNELKALIPFTDIIDEVKINISKKIKESAAQINIITAMPVLDVVEKSTIKLMENLICNAIKFSKAGEIPVINISAKELKTNWEFCIADNGIGIEAKSFKQIFAVFSKVHNNILYPGNGIGLAICRKAVEHHGGIMWVTSELNKGSKFHFTLPK